MALPLRRRARPSAHALAVLLLFSLQLAQSADAEEVGYSLDTAAGLFWRVEIAADDGLTSASDSVDIFCCAEVDALVLGERVGILDPTFTPETLTHLLQAAPVPLEVGQLTVSLQDLAGWLSWSPPSGPAPMSGESGPMETGPLSAAQLGGTLSTPFGDAAFVRGLLHHLGGDTTLRRFSAGADLGPPRLRMDTQVELLDSLEIDESDLAGRIEMRSPYEAVVAVSPGIVEAGSGSYASTGAAGLFWEITITGDDGVLPPSSDTVIAFQGLDVSVGGDVTGVVDPLFTPTSLAHSIADSGIALQVGAHGVMLDLSATLSWSPSGPSLMSGEEAPMPTGDATGASFAGTLTTPFGSVPFALGLADHLGGDMSLARISGQTELGLPRLQVSTTLAALDTLEIDEAEEAGRVDMRNPYEAVLGSSGGVTWSIAARVFVNDSFHTRLPEAPNGASRDVTWTLRAETMWNDVFYLDDPSLPPPPVPALGARARVLVALLLVVVVGGVARARARGA